MKEDFDRVLVACPTYVGKRYALPAYIAAFNAFSWPNRGLFMVDNTGTGLHYLEELQAAGVPCEHIDPSREWQETFARCWKRIYLRAKAEGYPWVASIEADNICPALTLDVLLNIAGFLKAPHVAHGYPWHPDQSMTAQLIGLGCNLISTELLEKVFEREIWYTDAFESEIFEYPKLHGMPCVEVYNVLDVRHLTDETGSEDYIFNRDNIPQFTRGRTSEGKPIQYVNAPPKFDLTEGS